MGRSIAQILSSGGPDFSDFASMCAQIGLGTMCTPQHQRPSFAADYIIKMSDLGLPPLRVGASIAALAGNLSTAPNPYFTAFGAPATVLPSDVLTFGAGNSQIRVKPRAGYTVRYMQFNPATKATSSSKWNVSQTTKAYVTGSGTDWEVWGIIGNDASGVATGTSAQLQAALKANPTIAALFEIIDGGTGNGSGVAVNFSFFPPSIGSTAAETMTTPLYMSPGVALISTDGNLLMLPNNCTILDMQYMPGPAVSPRNDSGLSF